MFNYPPKRKNPPVRRDSTEGFKELNTLAHPSMNKNEEATELLNAVYSQYGTTSKRPGSVILGGDGEGDSCDVLFAAYDVGGNDYLIRINSDGIPQYYNFDNYAWTDLAGTAPVAYVGTNPEFTAGVPTFDMSYPTQVVQSYGNIWFSNPVNDMVWFDGSAWYIRTALADPTVKATVAKTGAGTGTVTYYYQYVNYNSAGGTLASPGFESGDADGTGYKNAMPATLDTSTYLTITIPAAPAGTTRRAIFRGEDPTRLRYLDDMATSQTTYVDQGEKEVTNTAGTPTTNTTKGYHYYLMDVFERRMVGVTVEEGRSIVVWSDPYPVEGDFYHTPKIAGFDDYYVGDGEDINVIKTYTANNVGGLYVFKDSRIGVLEFSEDSGSVRDVTAFVGSLAPNSVHIAGNNLRFWSPEGPAMLGNEKNYGSILRYSVMGVKVENIANRITDSAQSGVASAFLNHKSYFSFSTRDDGKNNQMLVYDERYDAWSLWTGMYAKVLSKFKDASKKTRLFYGSSIHPRVVEMNTGKTDYGTTGKNGTKVVYSLTTRQYTMGLPDRFKKFDKIVFVFAFLSGNNTKVAISYANENGTFSEDPLPILSARSRVGFGTQQWGSVMVGYAGEITASNSLFVKYIDLAQQDMFWVQATITNDGVDDELSLLGMNLYYSDSNRMLPFEAQLTRQ